MIFDITYVKGNSIPHVDALSRLNYDDNSQATITENCVHWTTEEIIPWNELKEETKNDRLLQDIAQRIQSNNW